MAINEAAEFAKASDLGAKDIMAPLRDESLRPQWARLWRIGVLAMLTEGVYALLCWFWTWYMVGPSVYDAWAKRWVWVVSMPFAALAGFVLMVLPVFAPWMWRAAWRRRAKRGRSRLLENDVLNAYGIYSLKVMGMADVPALLGLFLFLLTRDWVGFVCLATLSLLAKIIVFPTQESLSRKLKAA